MRDSIRVVLEQSRYFGLALSIGVYLFTYWLRNKTGLAILNPLLVSIALIIGCIFGVGMDYETCNKGVLYLGRLLTPATTCLTIPLYKQLRLSRKHGDVVALGIAAGVATSVVSTFLMCKVLNLAHTHYVTPFLESIATAIGVGVSEEAGDIATLTVTSIVLIGVLGNMAGEAIPRLARIHHPVAKRLAPGISAHTVGTAKVLELGGIEGVVSNFFTAVAGLITVIMVPLMVNLI